MSLTPKFIMHIIIIMSFGKYTYGTPNIFWKNNNANLRVGNFAQ